MSAASPQAGSNARACRKTSFALPRRPSAAWCSAAATSAPARSAGASVFKHKKTPYSPQGSEKVSALAPYSKKSSAHHMLRWRSAGLP